MRRGIGYSITAWVFVLMVLLFGTSQAAETWISKAAGVKDPRKIALMPDGGLMVTAPVWNSIAMLGQNGNILNTISSQHPSALAVSKSGLIYVAVGKYSSNMPPYVTKGEIKVYDATFNYMYSLGAGSGEFVNPVDIEIGNDGSVYVADAAMNQVKIYNIDGSAKLSFGSYGIGDGFFNKSLAVAVDNATGNIYVADCQLRQDQFAGVGNSDGARIQAFDKNGNFIKGFGIYGELFSISDIKFYQGKLYVSDSYLDTIQVYDTVTGLLDHSFTNPAASIRQPSSMAISRDGILYVVGNGSNDINMFALDGALVFSATPAALDFAAIAGMTGPAAKNLTISNSGGGDIAWTLSGDAWISSSAASGTLAPGNSAIVAINVDPGVMPAGQYAGTITVTNQNGTANQVSVALNLIAPPQFALSTDSLAFGADAGSSSLLSQGMSVALNGALPDTYWTARATTGWLGANPVQAGTSASDVSVSVNTAGLPAGNHTGQIIFESQQPGGVSATVSVTLSVSSTGQISVTTNRADATFTITDANNVSFSGSSASWSKTHVPDGVYTITFDAIAGFATPQSATLSISNGSSIGFEGNYTDLSAANNIIASAPSGKKGYASVRIFSSDGKTLLKEFTPMASAKSKIAFNVAAGDVDGDGVKDIVVGLGNLGKSSARVALYKNDGTLMPGADFIALNSKGGVKVASGDFDNDGKDEIIVAGGESPTAAAQIRILAYDGASVKDTGIDFTAFSSKYGANVAVADIDGDGVNELLVAPGPDPAASPEVKAFKIDISAGVGNWSAVSAGLDLLPFKGKCGANIAAGDLDGDGQAEIVVASGSCASNPNSISAFYGDGSPFSFSFSDGTAGGLEVAVGDLDMDGQAEIVVSHDKINNGSARVDAYLSNGNSMLSFTAFEKKKSTSGAKIALGELGY